MLEPISISLQALNLPSLLPVGILIVGAIFIIVLDLVTKSGSKSFYTMLSILFILLDLGVVIGYYGEARGMFDLVLVDGIAKISQIIVLVTSAFFLLLAMSQRRFQEFSMAEFYALFLFMIAGFQFMTISDNLILIFVGLETASLSLYTMIAMHNRKKAFEAAIKYFTMGALAAGFYTMGSLLFYALTGSIEIHEIANRVILNDNLSVVALIAATIFMIGALGFKISIVPFHTWTPDIYEGSSAALAGYMSIVPKIAGFVVAMRLFEALLNLNVLWIENMFYILVIATMTVGNITALVQEDVKRMLAYSSIAHAGFVLSAILIGTSEANSGLFLYWILFMFTNLGAFTVLWMTRHKKNLWDERYQHPFVKFKGLAKINPFMATMMAFFMFSLAGVPPLSVFWGKLYLISAAVNAGFIYLAIFMALNSAIAVYYYMKLVIFMFLMEPASEEKAIFTTNATPVLKVVLAVAVAFTIFASLFIDKILAFIIYHVTMSGF
ncbi:MAG: NADH-quinone oxidoreductase subunit NuoN [Sulfurospirillum sp.]|nr:NADH-quinone oxidoreductase subunit NuoN [Sulfurospirillum sp.]